VLRVLIRVLIVLGFVVAAWLAMAVPDRGLLVP
jgi:hypothetical protein